jgi:hypothetical protein
MQRVIDALAGQKFPQLYDAARGVVRTHERQYRLRPGIAEATDDRLHDPHIRFFVERNPGHRQGDELCCAARLSRENFTPAAYRVLGRPR